MKIPNTLSEAHIILENELDPYILKYIDDMNDECEIDSYHHTLGRTIRNEWSLWSESPFKVFMENMGFRHPDDISDVVLRTLWCKRHNKPFILTKRAEHYAEYWKNVEEEKNLTIAVDRQGKTEIIWQEKAIPQDQ